VQHRGGAAFQMSGHGQHGAYGDDAGAAHAGHDDIAGARLGLRRGQGGQFLQQAPLQVGLAAVVAAPQRAAHDGYEAGAEAVHAGVILVAAGLVDLALAPFGSIGRHQRQAVGLHAAVAAAFAYGLVDEQAARRIGIFILLATAALFRRAGLVVDQDGHAGDLAQFALQAVQFAPVVHLHADGQLHAPVALGLVGGDDYAARALAQGLLADARHRDRAVHRLAARHGDGVVEENLVGDVGSGGDGLAYGQVAG